MGKSSMPCGGTRIIPNLKLLQLLSICAKLVSEYISNLQKIFGCAKNNDNTLYHKDTNIYNLEIG
jgi:hypothetical protein